MEVKRMSDQIEKTPSELRPVIMGTLDEHTCGAVDEREARMLTHQIMAEIRKSNAPIWVAEELQKKLDCQECCDSFKRLSIASLL
jgi:hypothetical protein